MRIRPTSSLFLLILITCIPLKTKAFSLPIFSGSLSALHLTDTTKTGRISAADTNRLTKSAQLLSPALSGIEEVQAPFLDSLITYAKKFMGVRYRYGGTSRSGFDCSGFTSYVFSKFGFKIPRTAPGQAMQGIKVKKDEVQKGDLIFFKGRNARSAAVGHVGIVISEAGEKIRFIHASVYRGITTDTIDSVYYKPRYITAARMIDTP